MFLTKILDILNAEDFSNDISLLVLYAFYLGRSYAVADYLKGSESWDIVLHGHVADPENEHTVVYALAMEDYIEKLWQERHPASKCSE